MLPGITAETREEKRDLGVCRSSRAEKKNDRGSIKGKNEVCMGFPFGGMGDNIEIERGINNTKDVIYEITLFYMCLNYT